MTTAIVTDKEIQGRRVNEHNNFLYHDKEINLLHVKCMLPALNIYWCMFLKTGGTKESHKINSGYFISNVVIYLL